LYGQHNNKPEDQASVCTVTLPDKVIVLWV
jgi:hypothetical protein